MALDRKFISRYQSGTFALNVYRDGVLASADADVEATLYRENASGTLTEVRTATLSDDPAGVYEFVVSSMDTSIPGDYIVRFDYAVDGVAQVYGYDVEFGPSSPSYEALAADWLGTVDDVWLKFADLFDSPFGGPNLQVYVQTNFGRNRLAQMLPDALQRLNSASSPHASYEFNGQGFPFRDWGGLLSQSLYLEVLKHLIRSYVEQPEVILGTAVSRVDRRDYMNRWREIYDMEQADFERDLGRYRMANMGLGNVHVLVSGGAFGRLGPFVNAGGAGASAARGYFSVNRAH